MVALLRRLHCCHVLCCYEWVSLSLSSSNSSFLRYDKMLYEEANVNRMHEAVFDRLLYILYSLWRLAFSSRPSIASGLTPCPLFYFWTNPTCFVRRSRELISKSPFPNTKVVYRMMRRSCLSPANSKACVRIKTARHLCMLPPPPIPILWRLFLVMFSRF